MVVLFLISSKLNLISSLYSLLPFFKTVIEYGLSLNNVSSILSEVIKTLSLLYILSLNTFNIIHLTVEMNLLYDNFLLYSVLPNGDAFASILIFKLKSL